MRRTDQGRHAAATTKKLADLEKRASALFKALAPPGDGRLIVLKTSRQFPARRAFCSPG
jgi:hypothetical protein